MTPRVEVLLWGATMVIAATAWAVARPGRSRELAQPGPMAVPHVPRIDTAYIARGAATIVASNPFRLTRAPSPIPFGMPQLPAPGMVAAPNAPPKPALHLRAVVGPPWEALLEGVPGKPGFTVVRMGDTVAGLTIRTIQRDSVIVRGMDTTWRLGVARAWQ